MMSKRVLIMLAIVCGLGTCLFAGSGSRSPIAYPPQTATVGNTSIMILPPVKADSGTNQWFEPTTNAYGDYVMLYSNNAARYFWCVTAGTNGPTEPLWSYTNDVTDGTVEWRYVNPVRNAFSIRNWGSGKMSISFNNRPAIINSGYTIPGSGDGGVVSGYDGRPCYQGRVNAISQALYTNTVSIHEE